MIMTLPNSVSSLQSDIKDIKHIINMLNETYNSSTMPYHKLINFKDDIVQSVIGKIHISFLEDSENLQIIKYYHEGECIIPKHVHLESDEYTFVLDGELILIINDEEYKITKGNNIYIKKKIPHFGYAKDGTVLISIIIPPDKELHDNGTRK